LSAARRLDGRLRRVRSNLIESVASGCSMLWGKTIRKDSKRRRPCYKVLRETRTISVVFSIVSDPVGSGFVASLSHPGGNATGFINIEPSMGGKWVELLKEVAAMLRVATSRSNSAGRRVATTNYLHWRPIWSVAAWP
jgi:hypothetical protein